MEDIFETEKFEVTNLTETWWKADKVEVSSKSEEPNESE
jgi:hypothetical protein